MNFLEAISESPDWLVQKAINANSATRQPSIDRGNTGILAGAMFTEGRRHSDFVAQAGLMRRKGASIELIEMTLLSTNAMLPDPLPDSEIRSIAQSMGRYSPEHIEALNHKALAQFLVQDLENRCLYCTGHGFYYYEDEIWQRDMEGLFVLNSAAELTDKMLAQVEQMNLASDDYKKLKKAVCKTQATGFLKNSIEQFKAKPGIRVSFDKFNSQKELVFFANCALNTQTLTTESHKPEHRTTWKLNTVYDPKAACPVFDRFLDDILTKPVQRLLLQLSACALTGSREQVLVFLVGEKQNGKSTFVKIIQDIFGDLCANVEPTSFMSKQGNHIPNDLARLAGKRLVFTSETKLGSVIDAPLLKRMTGGDTVTARFMRQEYFEFTPEFIPFIVTNYLPVIDGSDAALKRRMIIIPFDRIIPDEQVDRQILIKLKQEKSGIINRVLEGLVDYHENGLVIPDEVRKRVNEYADSSNLIKRFVDECLDVNDPNAELGARQLYNFYCCWCASCNVRPLSEPVFKPIFERTTGINQKYNSRRRFWPGIKPREGGFFV